MADKPATANARPRVLARYELDDDGMAWTIRIPSDNGDFVTKANRLQDVELRAYHTIVAVLGLPPGSFEVELEHVLNLEEEPAPAR
jgi:hypothetical protein